MSEDTFKKLPDRRHNSRILALSYLYSLFFIQKYTREDLRQNSSVFEVQSFLGLIEEKKYQKQLYSDIVEGVLENLEDIDNIIKKFAPAWPIDEVNLVNISILRIAIFEGFIKKMNPVKVVINEAIELAKEFSDPQSAKFINGVLGEILKSQTL